jgi:hypothetical protein
VLQLLLSRDCVAGRSWPVRSNRNRTVEWSKRIWSVLCSWLLRSSTKNRRGQDAEQNTEQRTWDGEPEGNVPAWFVSNWGCLHAIFSSVRRSTFHMTWNFFRNVERTHENLDRRVWTRGLGENTGWLRSHQDFRAGSASNRYRASKIATPSHNCWRLFR